VEDPLVSISIPRTLVEFILLGPEDDRRQLQDSPILADVWVEFAKRPEARLELLITPYKERAAGVLARELQSRLPAAGLDSEDRGPDVAYLHGIVAAALTFRELLGVVVPMTGWWNDRRILDAIKVYVDDPATMRREMADLRQEGFKWLADESRIAIQDLHTRRRYAALAGLILWAGSVEREPIAGTFKAQATRILEELDVDVMVDELTRVMRAALEEAFRGGAELSASVLEERKLVWTISLNRRASPALKKSIPSVKADAARTLFSVDCSEIVWAVIDSGIDATHDAFKDLRGKSRVVRTFDFTRIRDIVTLDNQAASKRRDERVRRLLHAAEAGTGRGNLKKQLSAADVTRHLENLAKDAAEERSINWYVVEQLAELDPATSPPATNHGTHVAGILAASRSAAEKLADAAKSPAATERSDWADGMCPDIRLYDFRVLAPTLKETEFAIIAALQYIRYVNERNSYMTVHGANLSLSIPHDVRNYACGRTPVCNECERLVNSGVVVVAAAGNRGYQNFETTEGLFQAYAAFSVTDPGNADGVITVGATHRSWPHTYGVSFFSSRGPTGDGRLKPDLVAPGERIRATLPGNQWGDLDGTSMAAPHVSGAAAMLMARYSELVGQPHRIKRVLTQSATDLGREKTFQGSGMLDVLRAFQSI
jgi:hypothetical protein